MTTPRTDRAAIRQTLRALKAAGIVNHDVRCEAHWNDGVCACPQRAVPRALIVRQPPRSLIRRIGRRLTLVTSNPHRRSS